jgi:hypothetical protein
MKRSASTTIPGLPLEESKRPKVDENAMKLRIDPMPPTYLFAYEVIEFNVHLDTFSKGQLREGEAVDLHVELRDVTNELHIGGARSTTPITGRKNPLEFLSNLSHAQVSADKPCKSILVFFETPIF